MGDVPSGGRSDAFTLGIAHRQFDRCVVDVVRAWMAPFNPRGVTAEVVDLLGSYGLTSIRGDRYAAEWVTEAFRKYGIHYRPAGLWLKAVTTLDAGLHSIVVRYFNAGSTGQMRLLWSPEGQHLQPIPRRTLIVDRPN